MTATSAASTLGNSWNRLSEVNGTIERQPLPAGLRFSPRSLADLDLPRGRILVLVEDPVIALDLQCLLRVAGYRIVGPATTVNEIQRLIERGDVDCAILDLDVDRRAPLPVADLLAFAEVPFVWLATGNLAAVPLRHRHRPMVEKPFTREALLAAVEKAMVRQRPIANDNGWRPGGSVVPSTRIYPPL
jgi:CheY-like chemotaxis protein